MSDTKEQRLERLREEFEQVSKTDPVAMTVKMFQEQEGSDMCSEERYLLTILQLANDRKRISQSLFEVLEKMSGTSLGAI